MAQTKLPQELSMKADLYTKSVLTVIAISLAFIAINRVKLISVANAQSKADLEAVISYCWDRAKIRKEYDDVWRIDLYC